MAQMLYVTLWGYKQRSRTRRNEGSEKSGKLLKTKFSGPIIGDLPIRSIA